MNTEEIRQLLAGVAGGAVAVDDALERIRSRAIADLGFARVDHDRALRDSLPEVVYAPGKTPHQVAAISAEIATRAGRLLVTRIDPAQLAALREALPAISHDEHARLAWFDPRPKPQTGHVAIVTAGTSDIPVAEEAALTAAMMGARVSRHFDVGVAGIHRLAERLEALRSANVCVVVAGMEGALPSVVGGLVANPVIAVPTSVGYGAAFGGLAPLLGMLNSCAMGIAVVNIDNGFGAGYMAGTINRLAVEGSAHRPGQALP